MTGYPQSYPIRSVSDKGIWGRKSHEHVVNIEDVVIASSHRVLLLAGSVEAFSFIDYIGERIS